MYKYYSFNIIVSSGAIAGSGIIRVYRFRSPNYAWRSASQGQSDSGNIVDFKRIY